MRLGVPATAAFKAQTLQACLTTPSAKWTKDSSKYTERVNAIRDMLIQTGHPVTYVDKLCVRAMFTVLDPKFVLPGITQLLLHVFQLMSLAISTPVIDTRVCLSVYLTVCVSVRKLSKEQVDGYRPNLPGRGTTG